MLKIVIAAMQGDGKAFEQLYHEYEDDLYYYALKLCKSPTDAEDTVQKTYAEE